MKGFLQSLWIVLAAAALAGGGYLWRPDALAWEANRFEIEMAQATALEDVLWVDARSSEEFAAGSFEGALLLNEDDWDAGFVRLLEIWTPDRPVVVFCSSSACLRSFHVAERLRADLGAEDIYTLKGGWDVLQGAPRRERLER